tara:strand:- start:360 stop:1073 length:714 start_codon:yes stop_codon:yes gene_type:complete
MKHFYLVIIILQIACSCSIQKRHHLPGINIENRKFKLKSKKTITYTKENENHFILQNKNLKFTNPAYKNEISNENPRNIKIRTINEHKDEILVSLNPETDQKKNSTALNFRGIGELSPAIRPSDTLRALNLDIRKQLKKPKKKKKPKIKRDFSWSHIFYMSFISITTAGLLFVPYMIISTYSFIYMFFIGSDQYRYRKQKHKSKSIIFKILHAIGFWTITIMIWGGFLTLVSLIISP